MVIKHSSKNKNRIESKWTVLHCMEERQLAELHCTEASCQAPQRMSPSLTGGRCSGRFPHSKLSAQIYSPHTAQDIFLGFFITGCWIWLYWEAPEKNLTQLVCLKSISITVHFLSYVLPSRTTRFHPSFKTEMLEIISFTINPPGINN